MQGEGVRGRSPTEARFEPHRSRIALFIPNRAFNGFYKRETTGRS